MSLTTSAVNTSFYITGGTLPADAPSYVTRQADEDLLTALLANETCYLLNSRQMGKSSLCVRTLVRLQQEGVRTAFCDLTRYGGRNLTAEQWYAALLADIGRELGVRAAFLAYWKENLAYPPVQRLFGAIVEVGLTAETTPMAVFLDEIDVTLSLPFSTDEFFAAIRQCYVGRATDERLKRLSFCLLGTATPSDLIQDTRVSPFNIGTRIPIRDFTVDEARPLAFGMGGGTLGFALLARVLYWTDGHPYLTQRLCRSAQGSGANSVAAIDKLCTDLFLTHTAQESDDNLAFVRNRLLKSEADLAALLDLYGRMRAGKQVPDDETNPLCAILKLSGVARVEAGYLRVRNRIYTHVFDRQWILTHMPDAEVRRQRAAYRRGVVRTTGGFLGIFVVLTALTVYAFQSNNRARASASRARMAAKKEKAAHDLATLGEHQAKMQLYVTSVNLAQQELRDNNLSRVLELLNSQRPLPGQQDMRGFEWRHLWSLCHRETATFSTSAVVTDVTFSPDGRLLAWADAGSHLCIQDRQSGQQIACLPAAGVEIRCVAFSPDSRCIAFAGANNTVVLSEVRSQKLVRTLQGQPSGLNTIAFAPNGRLLVTGSRDKTIRIWDLIARRDLPQTLPGSAPIQCVRFTPDSRSLVWVAVGEYPYLWGDFCFWDIARHKVTRHFHAYHGLIAFTPDGKKFACGTNNVRFVACYDMQTGHRTALLEGNSSVRSLAFAPDSHTIGVGYENATFALWNVAGKQASVATITVPAHGKAVSALCFASDNRTLATGSDDLSVKLWDTDRLVEKTTIPLYKNAIYYYEVPIPADCGGGIYDPVHSLAMAFEPDGNTIATSGPLVMSKEELPIDCSLRWYKAEEGKPIATCGNLPGYISALAMSRDGSYLLAGDLKGNLSLWDEHTKQLLTRFSANPIADKKPSGARIIYSVAFAPDGDHFASAQGDGTVRVWRVSDRTCVLTLPVAATPVVQTAYSPDGSLLAAVVFDEVSLWDTHTGKRLDTKFKNRNRQPVTACSFSPDGKTLAVSGEMGSVNLWPIPSGRNVIHLSGRYELTNSVCFSPDGKTLAVSEQNGAVKLWNVETKSEVDSFAGKDAYPVLVFSPSGTQMAISTNLSISIRHAPSLEEITRQMGK